MASVKLVIRSDRKGLGSTTIYAQYTYKGDKKKFSTGRTVVPQQWDPLQQKVLGSGTEIQALNAHLQKVRGRLDNIILGAHVAEAAPTLAYVTERFTNETSAAQSTPVPKGNQQAPVPDFLDLFDEYITAARATLAHGTYKHYKTTLNHLRSFATLQKGKLTLDRLDALFYYHFITFLTQSKAMSNGTANNQLKRVKVVMGYAAARGLTSNTSFRNFKMLRNPQKPIVYLTQQELEGLFRFDLTDNPRLATVRDLLVFACATGLRYSDFSRVQPEHIQDDTLRLRTLKTKQWQTIELNPYSRAILAHHPEGLPNLSQQKFNAYVKELGKHCGVDAPVQVVVDQGGKTTDKWVPKHELMSSHIGRKTFVTQSIERGMDASVVMKFTGHRDYRSMSPYHAVATEEKRRQMDQAWG